MKIFQDSYLQEKSSLFLSCSPFSPLPLISPISLFLFRLSFCSLLSPFSFSLSPSTPSPSPLSLILFDWLAGQPYRNFSQEQAY